MVEHKKDVAREPDRGGWLWLVTTCLFVVLGLEILWMTDMGAQKAWAQTDFCPDYTTIDTDVVAL